MKSNITAISRRSTTVAIAQWCLLFLVWVFTSIEVFGQQMRVTGTVTDMQSEPLIGVSIQVKGSKTGVITNIDGAYTITAKKGDVLKFSYIGMINKEVTVKNSSVINVQMITDSYDLEDVVVVGYGTTKKSDLTGAVASIKPDNLKASKIGVVSNALQGMAAGVQVTNGNMKPGGDAGIVVRGVGSVNAGSSPLLIVDGVVSDGGLQDISSNDIESIDVLKDASSASIYGSRGSNGVILVTTKKGSSDRARVSFNASGGFQQMLNKQKLMTAQQYYDLIETTGQTYTWTTEELLLLSRGESTDWQDAVTQNGNYQNYNLSLSGGSEKVTHFLGIDYYKQNGTIKNSSFDKLTVRYNMDAKLNDWVRYGARFNMIQSNLSNINEESDSGYGTMFSAISSQPTAPIYTADGEYFDGFLNTKANPVAIVDLLDRQTKKTKGVADVYIEFEPIKNLRIKSDNAIEYVSYKVNEYEDGRMGQHYNANGHATIMSNLRNYWQTENTVNYDFSFGKNKVGVMGGFSASRVAYEEVTADSKDLNAILKYNSLGSASEHGPNSSYASASTLTSVYGRLNYNYGERYLATFTMRADGSSKFAPGHRWGYFPSLAVAWRISEEGFMHDVFNVDNLKLRVSVGMLGNQNIGDYAYAALVSQGGAYNNYPYNGSLSTGAEYSSISNPNLTWEKAKQLDLGFDFGFFGNRLSGTVEYYYKRTSDLLWSVPLPYESGYTSSLTNVGKLDNKGVEVTLNSVNINTRNFQWTTSFNISYNKNKIVELYDGKQDVGKTLFVGHSLNEFFVLKSNGLWQLNETTEAAQYLCEPGDRKIVDINGDGVINGDDRVFAGQSTPTYYGGMTNNFKYRDFDLSIVLTYAGGHKINNSLNRYLNSYNTWGNMSEAYYNHYWRADRPSNKYPAPRVGSPYSNGDGTDANLQDGKYLRIKNIELGYSLPSKVSKSIKATNIRFYVALQNIYTFTKFTGYDVESWDNTNPYPSARGFIGGVSLNF